MKRQFTDREAYIDAFDQALPRLDEATYHVLVFYGVGGIGKTALRKHLGTRLAARSDDPVPWAALDLYPPDNRKPEHALFLARKALQRSYKFRRAEKPTLRESSLTSSQRMI